MLLSGSPSSGGCLFQIPPHPIPGLLLSSRFRTAVLHIRHSWYGAFCKRRTGKSGRPFLPERGILPGKLITSPADGAITAARLTVCTAAGNAQNFPLPFPAESFQYQAVRFIQHVFHQVIRHLPSGRIEFQLICQNSIPAEHLRTGCGTPHLLPVPASD